MQRLLKTALAGLAVTLMNISPAVQSMAAEPAAVEPRPQTSTATPDREFLKGLKKIEKAEGSMNLNLSKVKIYTEDGKTIDPAAFMEALKSNKYTLDAYEDENKELKACVLRLMTKAELARQNTVVESGAGKSTGIGGKAIPFTVTDIAGKEYALDKLQGKVVVMNFWFTQCKPCVDEMPELNKLVEKYKDTDVVFLGFALDPKAALDAFLQKNEFKYAVVPASLAISKNYGINGYPCHIVIDKDSNIAYRFEGLTSTSVASLDKEIDKLVSGRVADATP